MENFTVFEWHHIQLQAMEQRNGGQPTAIAL